MWRIPFVSGRGRDKDTGPGQVLESRIPWWIDQLPRVGWPLVAVAVMVMCAPGEHHLAHLAGWSERLAWLMPAVMVAYAGIAASVATRRVKGTPGRKTAILGAWLSIGLAMAAQPVSHMFVTGHWDSSPAPVWIVWAVSLVPGGVLGHLMHVAASHVVSRRKDVPALPVLRGELDTPVPPRTTERTTRPKMSGLSRRDRNADFPAVSAPSAAGQDSTGDKVSLVHPGRPTAVSRPAPVSLADRVSMSARALVLVQAGHDEDTVKDTLRTEFTDDKGVPPKADSIRKAYNRAAAKVSRAS